MIVEQIWTANAYRDFDYVIACEETGEARAIDPLDEEKCLATAKPKGWTVRQILNTHEHRDLRSGVFEAACDGDAAAPTLRAGPPPAMSRPETATAERLRRHVENLAGVIGERNVFRPAALAAAREYIAAEWRHQGHQVSHQ